MFEVNVGQAERVARIGLGLAILVLGFGGGVTGDLGLVAGLVGSIPLLTGVTGWCPLYGLFGIHSHSVQTRTEP